MARFTAAVAAASWDSLVLERADGSLVRIPLRDPHRFTRDEVGDALAGARDADDLVARLSGPDEPGPDAAPHH